MKKGFTLLELLIVIAILAILAAAAVVVLNPAELLRRARDSERITDIANIRNAMNLYLTTVTSVDLDANNGVGSAGTGCQGEALPSLFVTTGAVAFASGSSDGLGGAGSLRATSTRGTSGTNGWLPVNFGLTAGGSPLSSLPIDAVSDADNAYWYMCSSNSSSTYELGTNMESATYANGGGDDVESTDGGDGSAVYEVGNDAGLDLGA